MENSIVFATHNEHKIKEAQALVQGSSFVLTGLRDYPILKEIADIPETGKTFEENSEQKVDCIRQYLDISVVADDSGLEVVSLNGLPGVHSKRWVEGSDLDRNNYLLKQLKDTKDRSAQFVTVLCYYDKNTQTKHFFEGVVEGMIAKKPTGRAGFGYDPLFIPEGYDQTFAELGQEVKNTLSHRAHAFQKLKEYLLNQ